MPLPSATPPVSDLPACPAPDHRPLAHAPLASFPLAHPGVRGFYDPCSGSIQYVVSDPATQCCAVIDPVLDFDPASGSFATRSADAILDYLRAEGLCACWILDTHPHADHVSAAPYLREQTGAPTAIGARVTGVQRLWRELYRLPDLPVDGQQWDRLLQDDDRLAIGQMEARVLFSPGHTLASVSYVVGDAAFIHDTLFMPDSGTARADFPGGDARALWHSIGRILSLPPDTRLFTGHDYRPQGRPPAWESTVAEQRQRNGHVAGQDENSFVRLREARDRTLPLPRLMLHALQMNIRGGRPPPPEADGGQYLRIPLNRFPGAVWPDAG